MTMKVLIVSLLILAFVAFGIGYGLLSVGILKIARIPFFSKTAVVATEKSADHLISLLKDNDSSVRQAAATRLGKLKDPRAGEPLIAALNDKEAKVRNAAARALGILRDARAVDPLKAALERAAGGEQTAIREALDRIETARKAGEAEERK